MKGHIRKRGKSYSFVLDIGVDQNGKRKQKWYSGYKLKEDAEKAMHLALVKIEKGDFFETEKITLKDYLEKWLENYAKINLTYNTFKSYKENIYWYIIPSIGKLLLSQLKPLHLQDFYKKCITKYKLSATTTLYQHRILHAALTQAVKWQMLNSNPSDYVNPPKNEKSQMQVLNANECNILLDRLKNTTIYLPVVLALTTGMRRGEICGLKWSNIDLINKSIYVSSQLQLLENNVLTIVPTKTKASNRKIYLSDFTISILTEYYNKQQSNISQLGENYINQDFVVCMENGIPYNPAYITRNFARYMNKLSKELTITRVRFHDLRHTHATLLLKQGINPKIVSERLGHNDIIITLNTYSHVLPDMQKEAAEKLNLLFEK